MKAEHGLTWLDNQSVNLIFTSPPYAEQRMTTYDSIPADEYIEWFMEFVPDMARVLTDDGSFFLNIKEHSLGGFRETYVLETVLKIIKETDFKLIDTFCWTKNGFPRVIHNSFKNSWEAIYHFAKQPKIKIHPERVMVDINPITISRTKRKPSGLSNTKSGFEQPSFANFDGKTKAFPGNHLHINNVMNKHSLRRFHPAVFPEKLVEFFILAFSDAGDLVLDPFIGSGTTAIVAKKHYRNFIGFDNNPEYVKNIRDIIGLDVEL